MLLFVWIMVQVLGHNSSEFATICTIPEQENEDAYMSSNIIFD